IAESHAGKAPSPCRVSYSRLSFGEYSASWTCLPSNCGYGMPTCSRDRHCPGRIGRRSLALFESASSLSPGHASALSLNTRPRTVRRPAATRGHAGAVRAAVVPRHGPAHVIEVREDWPEPEPPGEGEVLVAVEVAGLNPSDTKIRARGGPGAPGGKEPPYVAGREAAGTMIDYHAPDATGRVAGISYLLDAVGGDNIAAYQGVLAEAARVVAVAGLPSVIRADVAATAIRCRPSGEELAELADLLADGVLSAT